MEHIATVIDGNFSDINPMQFGYQACKPKHSYGPAVRTHWLVHYIVSGCGIFKINNKTYNVSKGEIFVIPPFVETYYQADIKDPWEYIWVGFTTKGELPIILDDVIFCPEAESVFEKMKTCKQLANGRTAYLSGRIWDLFSMLLENKTQQISYVEKAKSFIHSEYANNITVQQIADRLGLNRSYFSILFKEETNMSPIEYLVSHRMKIAASLLTKRGMNVTIAANSVGYNDIFTFSKMFKRYYGVSPSKFATECHKNEDIFR